MKTKVHNHASVILPYRNQEIVTNIYDNTYPKEIWRNRINFIGGGQSPGEISPHSLLEREINEEFRINSEELKKYDKNFRDMVGNGKGAPKITNFALEEDITLVREFLLSNFKPWGDFLVTIPPYKEKPSFNVILSLYSCELSDKIMSCFKKNELQKKSLVSEGFLKINKLSDIESGKIPYAWATGLMIGDFFGKNIPNPEKIICKKIGFPKNSMNDYFQEYNYFVR